MFFLFVSWMDFRCNLWIFDVARKKQIKCITAFIYLNFVSRSRDVIFNAIKRLTQRADKFSNHHSVRKDDQEWIEKKLVEGNYRQVRDISQIPTPSKISTPLSPKRPVVSDDLEFFGRGKRPKIPRTPCKNAGCTDKDCTSTEHHSSSPAFMVSQNFKNHCTTTISCT